MTTDAPHPTTPETRDWTIVLTEGCEQCGYVPSSPHDSSSRLAAAAAEWPTVLASPDVAKRPAPHTWSPLEYAAHARDMVQLLGTRVADMLTTDDPQFEDWDGDAKAIELEYWKAEPAQIASDIELATRHTRAVLARIGVDDWDRPGHRSDGVAFTVATMCQYLVHDVEHHLMDARLGAGI
ncbi:MAG TPA: DinB family protein [Tessaracoccus flavescens]|uniref:DinB family protein n=1 Tax=Tessaracoccus flavescens TaxID=399497 RepID=A0A921EPR5_9ACTN|nr:DinB family protein [Tessaracoccus flavescens]